MEFGSCSEDVSWVIKDVWLSYGRYHEIVGCFYAEGEGYYQSYQVELYMMKFRGPEAVGESRIDRGSVEAFYGKKYLVGRILEIDAWFHMHPGLKKRVYFSIFRLPSPFASPYFVRYS